jgi:beta-glucanase (GH16 family)
MMRTTTVRTAVAAALVGSLVAWAATASADGRGISAAAAPRASTPMATTIIRKTAGSSGDYTLVVSVRSGGRQSRLVRVYVTGQKERTIRAYRSKHAELTYRLRASHAKILVRAVNAPPAVVLGATLTQTSKTGSAGSGGATGSNGATGASGATGSTGSTPPSTQPTTIPTTPGSLVTNPYTNLLWSDNFIDDFNAGDTAPLASDWSLDQDGGPSGCGTGTQSTFTNAAPGATLTANGLQITATSDGAGGYTSAQLDGAGLESIPVGATIEASIALPQGQGLCPAFWMLGDSDAAGTTSPGEIDILEAPSFVGSQWGPTAPYAVFTIHAPQNGPNAQLYEFDASPAGWNPTNFNTYGVIWTQTSITWTVNGLAYATANAGSLPAGATWSSFDTNFHLLLDLAVGGWPGSSSVSSATMLVQWVQVYN